METTVKEIKGGEVFYRKVDGKKFMKSLTLSRHNEEYYECFCLEDNLIYSVHEDAVTKKEL